METKICFKCGLEKDFTEFYKHPKTRDGYLGKCKECAKSDVKSKYEENIENPDFVEKERARCRNKYARLNYNGRWESHRGMKNTRRYLKGVGVELDGFEAHHWNYKLKNDVFILTPRAHKLVHKYIVFDGVSMFFYHGTLLSTKEEHFKAIKGIFSIHKVTYQIGSYPII